MWEWENVYKKFPTEETHASDIPTCCAQIHSIYVHKFILYWIYIAYICEYSEQIFLFFGYFIGLGNWLVRWV